MPKQKHKIVRFLGVTLALLSVFVFVTVVSSGWHHHDSADESHCSYCHVSHQPAVQAGPGQRVAALALLATVPPPIDFANTCTSGVSLTASRAPPVA